ncbi:MAG: M20/M25/M40 family metallo-hydrolase, partial [Acetobacteraceae bacterium]
MLIAELGSSESLLEELADWVRTETPTSDASAVNGLIDRAERELAEAGAVLRRTPGHDGFGDTLLARTPGPAGKPVLMLGHLDTVWNNGTLATMPFRIAGEEAHGPGIYDMKAGSFLGFHVLRTILKADRALPRPVALMLTPDEEVGSPTSRALIEREGAAAAYVLIPEPAGAG